MVHTVDFEVKIKILPLASDSNAPKKSVIRLVDLAQSPHEYF
jgi:hypothetical protein